MALSPQKIGLLKSLILCLCALGISAILANQYIRTLASPDSNSSSSDASLDAAISLYYSNQYDQAKAIFEDLKGQNPKDAYYYLALIARNTAAPSDNRNEFVHLIQHSAELGNSLAMRELAYFYESKDNPAADPMRALDWYRAADAASSSSSDVQYLIESDGNFVAKDAVDVLQNLQTLAERGEADAQYRLARLYDLGQTVPQNMQKARYWYEQAAISGHSYSQYLLGYFYCRGIEVSKSPDTANAWLKKSGRDARCHNQGDSK